MAEQSELIRDPDQWTTTLAREAGEQVDDDLTKAEDELREKTGRGNSSGQKRKKRR